MFAGVARQTAHGTQRWQQQQRQQRVRLPDLPKETADLHGAGHQGNAHDSSQSPGLQPTDPDLGWHVHEVVAMITGDSSLAARVRDNVLNFETGPVITEQDYEPQGLLQLLEWNPAMAANTLELLIGMEVFLGAPLVADVKNAINTLRGEPGKDGPVIGCWQFCYQSDEYVACPVHRAHDCTGPAVLRWSLRGLAFPISA